LTLGQFDGMLKASLRSDHIGGQAGEVLRDVLEGFGSAGGHDKRAGGVVNLAGDDPRQVDGMIERIERRFLDRLGIAGGVGVPLLGTGPSGSRFPGGADSTG
jgi:hypothetical protein